MSATTLTLKDKVLIAAVEGVGADINKRFTIEDLAVWAWQRDKTAWGLRGHEESHPDLDKIRKDMGARGAEQKGVVQLGWVERIEPRVYKLTPAGLAEYSMLMNETKSANPVQDKVNRELASQLAKILQHPVFLAWLKDSAKPKYFRDAGHFWGIAPGTPAKIVRDRIQRIDDTLHSALRLLDEKGIDEIAASRGSVLFDRNDVERCIEFEIALKKRFARDLKVLDPQFAASST